MSRGRKRTSLFGLIILGMGNPVFLASMCGQDAAERLAPMTVGKQMFVAAGLEGRIYCVGGNDPAGKSDSTLHVYDVANNSWTRKADWPTPSTFPCGAAIAGKLYVVGGPTGDKTRTSQVERYDSRTDAWERLADLPIERSHSVAVAKGDRLYVIGGHRRRSASDSNEVAEDLADVHVLNTRTGRWSKGPPLPKPTHGMAAAVVNGSIHVLGGLTEPDQHLVLEGEQWLKRASAPFPVVKMPAASIHGKIVVIGGGNDLAQVAVYDPADDRWTNAAPTRVSRFLSQAVAVGDMVYVLGGIKPAGGSQTKLESFDLGRNRWHE